MEDLLTDLVPAFVLASKTKRWVAVVIDYVIYSIIVWTLGYTFGTATGPTSWELNGFPGFLVVVIPWFVLFPVIEWFNNGQTVGKALFRIKATSMDGSKAGFGQVFLRHFFDWVDYLPFLGIVGLIVAANNPQKQRVGDLVAKTIVIDKQR